MLHRLFKNKNISDSQDNYTRQLLEPQPWQPQTIQQDHVRIIFCQDAGESNKTILFDSDYNHTTSNTNTASMAHSWNDERIIKPTSLESSHTSSSFHSRNHAYMRTMPSLSDHRHVKKVISLI
ncbi:hypothetical protein RMATCC62417_15344 [Rhizopus microsporus]|nr:hypothetical protein RMATCC62417_15344 [Rhizopus microsporus]